MQLKLGGFTAAGVLVVAIVGGAVGGALTMSSSPAPAPAVPAGPVTLHQVAGEVTPTPVPSASADTSPASIPAVSAVAPVTAPAPAPVAAVGGSGETAGEAADRAEDAADRAEKAAERAGTSPTAPKLKPTTAPVTEEEPVAKPEPACKNGEHQYDAYVINADGSKTGGAVRTCKDGAWVTTKQPHTIPAPAPKPTQPQVDEPEVVVVPPAG